MTSITHYLGSWVPFPTPNEVRQLAALQNLPTGKFSVDPKREEYIFPPEEDLVRRRYPVIFHGMNLMAKWGGLCPARGGHHPSTPFANTSRAVPEVHAGRVGESEVFICMEHVRGRALSSIVEEINFSEHVEVIQRLRSIVNECGC